MGIFKEERVDYASQYPPLTGNYSGFRQLMSSGFLKLLDLSREPKKMSSLLQKALEGLPETNACAWWLETGSKSSMGRFLIHIDAQDGQDLQDFFRRRRPCSPGHPSIRTRSPPESASRAAASHTDYPVHPVHRCSVIWKTGTTGLGATPDRL